VTPPLASVSSARSNVAPVAFFTVAHAEKSTARAASSRTAR
jgi:hypothetical protein